MVYRNQELGLKQTKMEDILACCLILVVKLRRRLLRRLDQNQKQLKLLKFRVQEIQMVMVWPTFADF